MRWGSARYIPDPFLADTSFRLRAAYRSRGFPLPMENPGPECEGRISLQGRITCSCRFQASMWADFTPASSCGQVGDGFHALFLAAGWEPIFPVQGIPTASCPFDAHGAVGFRQGSSTPSSVRVMAMANRAANTNFCLVTGTTW